jgi:hypothetical protein
VYSTSPWPWAPDRGEDDDEELLGLLGLDQPVGERVLVRAVEAGNRITTNGPA